MGKINITMSLATRFNFKLLRHANLTHPVPKRSLPGLTLNRTNDIMPQVGLGTWLAEAGQVRDATNHVLSKLEYLHIDGAMIYFNEQEVGEGMKQAFNSTP